MNFSSLLSTSTVLFLLIITGIVARKIGVIDDVASKRLSRLIIVIGQPMMIINALIKIEYSADKAKEGFIMLLISIALHIFISVLSFFSTAWIKKADERKITEFSIIFANAGFLGFPIFRSLFGDIGEFWGSFYVVGFNLVVWTWGMAILGRGREDIKLTPKRAILNYGTVPCLIGIAMYFAMKYIEIPAFLVSYTGFLASFCTPISALIVGALIATRKPRQIFLDGRVYFACLFRLIVIPLAVCIVTKLLFLPEYIILFSTAAMALPSATNVTMFAELYDIAPGYASQTVGVSSLLTVVTMPFVMLAADFIVKL